MTVLLVHSDKDLILKRAHYPESAYIEVVEAVSYCHDLVSFYFLGLETGFSDLGLVGLSYILDHLRKLWYHNLYILCACRGVQIVVLVPAHYAEDEQLMALMPYF